MTDYDKMENENELANKNINQKDDNPDKNKERDHSEDDYGEIMRKRLKQRQEKYIEEGEE